MLVWWRQRPSLHLKVKLLHLLLLNTLLTVVNTGRSVKRQGKTFSLYVALWILCVLPSLCPCAHSCHLNRVSGQQVCVYLCVLVSVSVQPPQES